MTREEALDTMGATLDDWLDKKNMAHLIDQIFNDHEEQLKAKDTAIELLESMCNLGLETQNKYSRIVKAKDEEIERLRVENRSCEGCIDAIFPLPKTCSNCERNKADLYRPKEQ